MASTIGERLRLAVHRSALGATGGVLLLVGLGFLTASAWIALSLVAGAATASLIVGLAYVGAGTIFLALAQRRRPPRRNSAPVTAPRPATGMPDVMAAFAQGLGAGMAARKRG